MREKISILALKEMLSIVRISRYYLCLKKGETCGQIVDLHMFKRRKGLSRVMVVGEKQQSQKNLASGNRKQDPTVEPEIQNLVSIFHWQAKYILVGHQDKHSEMNNSSILYSTVKDLTITPGNAQLSDLLPTVYF